MTHCGPAKAGCLAAGGLTRAGVCGWVQAMAPTLLVLAAGMGSRYGGLKQMDPVGPSGETMLDYAVFDAARAGFGRAVFIIRRDFEAAFRETVLPKYRGRIEADVVSQDAADLPGGFRLPADRQKPWGTGHAVWCARGAIPGPFAVINADDFYGRSSYASLARFLGAASGPTYAIVGFRLANTLSESGTVSRGVCAEQGGSLTSITEVTAIASADVGPGRRFTGTEVVSMNCWGFTPAVFDGLGERLEAFLAARGSDPKAEFYLPAAVSDLIARSGARVQVIASEDSWFGITYREDRPRVVASIARLVSSGAYPQRLFP
jgi:NDP-sugar pyrophosphorylase family protein